MSGMSDEELRTVVRLRQEAVGRRDMEEAVVKECSERLGTELCLRGAKSQRVDDWAVSIVDRVVSTLDATLLVQAGVTAEQIAKGKRESRSSSVQVRRAGGHG